MKSPGITTSGDFFVAYPLIHQCSHNLGSSGLRIDLREQPRRGWTWLAPREA